MSREKCSPCQQRDHSCKTPDESREGPGPGLLFKGTISLHSQRHRNDKDMQNYSKQPQKEENSIWHTVKRLQAGTNGSKTAITILRSMIKTENYDK